MKIIAQTSSISSRITSNSAQYKKFVFEKCLASPERQNTGDEYYWPHQHQLQNSALHFNFDSQVNKAITKGREETERETDSSYKNLTENKQILLLNEVSQPIEASQSKPSLQDELSPLFKLISKLIMPFIPEKTELNNQHPSCWLNKNEPLENKTFFHRIIFKNFQLFIEAKEAELSLNGLDLNKQQLRELNQALKHWLQSKGIKLQKLVINGVIL